VALPNGLGFVGQVRRPGVIKPRTKGIEPEDR